MNDSAASTHGNIRVDSVFISASGEWKLGGFELLSSPKDDAAVLYVRSTQLMLFGVVMNVPFPSNADHGQFDARLQRVRAPGSEEGRLVRSERVL